MSRALTKRFISLTGPLAAVFGVLAVGGAVGAPLGQTTMSVEYDDPTWSPGGKQLAFVARTTVSDGDVSQTTASLMTMALSRRVPREVATLRPDRVAWPDWSPDGRRIVFGAQYLYVVEASGRRLRELGAGCCASWGPGGRKIAFSTGPETQSEIQVMDVTGRNRLVAASPNQTHSYWGSTWSPDGERLAFFSDSAPDIATPARTSLAAIGRYRGPVRTLRSGVYAAEPDWAPSGKKIAFNGIRVLDLTTKRLSALHEGQHPRWSPDGRRLAFVHQGQVFVMNADGTNVRQLTR
jgi:dipeptidyl aminopeptidase/acylaminoacyl peptidase